MTFLSNLFKKTVRERDWFVLFCILFTLVSFLIALISAPSQVAFYYDQARDAYQSYVIWNDHHLKILGPQTDIPGIFHGVFWYYFITPLYWIGQGNPIVATILLTILFYLTVPMSGYVAYLFTQKKRIAFLTMALYSGAPLMVNFSHWLSNPVLTVLLIPFLLYFLFRLLTKPDLFSATMTGLLYALMIQSDLAFLPLVLLLPVYFFIYRTKPSIVHTVAFLIAFLLGVSSFFVANIKFHSNVFEILFNYTFEKTSVHNALDTSILGFIDAFIHIVSISYIYLPLFITGAVLIYLIFAAWKHYMKERTTNIIFLEVWTVGLFLLFFLNHGNGNTLFFFAPILLSTAILLATLLESAFPKKRALYVLIVLCGLQFFGNVSSVIQQSSYLIIQPGMIYSTETQVVDYTYQQSHGQPFVIGAVTNPLYIATTWSYIYSFYGKSHYGYLPYWGGKSQVGQLNSLQENPKNITIRYLITDPQDIIPYIWKEKIYYEEDKVSDVVEEKKIGKFTVQKRILRPTKLRPPAPDILRNDQTILNF